MDIQRIFTHQDTPGPFRFFAVVTSCLNYLDGLHRAYVDPLRSVKDRTDTLHELVAVEKDLYQYIRQETMITYFDADIQAETERYIMARQLFIKATDFTFKRHRHRFLLQLLRLYEEDPCNILPERQGMIQKLEDDLFQHYILLDMGWKNTEDIGREAISNGYHECDYTLDIEDVWKQPTKAIPPSHFRYVLDSLPVSNYARSAAMYLVTHGADLQPSRWVVDVAAIEEAAQKPVPPLTADMVKDLKRLYNRI